EHRGGASAAEVVDACARLQPLNGRNMPVGDVHHVQVVAQACAVWGVIVAAKNVDLRQLSHGNLEHVGGQVVRNLRRVLTDAAARVGADRVEVAQRRHLQL